MKRLLLTLICSASLALVSQASMFSQPAHAAVQRSSDFEAGHTLGVGLYGLSYDYGVSWFSIGLQAGSRSAAQSLYPSSYTTLNLSSRLMARVYQEDGLTAGVIAGLQLDPGSPGDRAYLTPDLGVAIAYDFSQFEWPFVIRMNLTLALSERNTAFYGGPVSSSDYSQPSPNLLQRLIFGPQTSLELAWLASENMEITTGGGTLLGMRLKF